jgi:predicted nucleotidyltransferase
VDTEGLLKSLKEHKVDFVIIGATAFPIHGYARATLDIDIFIRPTEANAQRTRKALSAFGYDLSDIRNEDFLKKKLLIRQYAVESDIHPFVKGITFERVWKNKIKQKFGHTLVYFASLNDIIKMKESANRPKDRDDLKYLRKLKQKK